MDVETMQLTEKNNLKKKMTGTNLAYLFSCDVF